LRPFDVVPIGVVVARRHSPEQTFFIGSRGSMSELSASAIAATKRYGRSRPERSYADRSRACAYEFCPPIYFSGATVMKFTKCVLTPGMRGSPPSILSSSSPPMCTILTVHPLSVPA